MRKLYAEGVAIHGGPESCVSVREGVGEALTGVRAGRAIEPRNDAIGVPTLSQRWKATLSSAFSRAGDGPRVVLEPGHVRKPSCARTGRAHARPPGDHWVGRSGNAAAVRLR